MSTKLIGFGAVVMVGLTAAAGGYAVLRGPVPVVSEVPATQAPAPAAPASTPTPALPVASLPTGTERPTPIPPAAPAPAPVPAPPAAPVAPPPPGVATSPPPVVERYVPVLDPEPPVAAPKSPEAEAAPSFEELTVSNHSVIGIRMDHAVSTRTARVEDRISAVVSRDVTVDGRVAIPVGAKLEGIVTAVDVGGKFRERPRLGLRFDTMILTDGTRLSISTDTIVREGESPSADAVSKVGGGAVAGAILGAVLGGKKGAAIGGAAGAAGGTAAVMRSDGEEASLRAGTPLTVRLTADLTVQVRR